MFIFLFPLFLIIYLLSFDGNAWDAVVTSPIHEAIDIVFKDE